MRQGRTGREHRSLRRGSWRRRWWRRPANRVLPCCGWLSGGCRGVAAVDLAAQAAWWRCFETFQPGFITDFADLKPFAEFLNDELDRKNLHEVLPVEPTSERLALFLAQWSSTTSSSTFPAASRRSAGRRPPAAGPG